MTDWDFINSEDGTKVPLRHLAPAAAEPKAAFLMLPALGVEARFYRRLANGLAAQGIATTLMEQRGHGRSKERAKRGRPFGVKAFLDNDIPAAVAAVQAKYPSQHLYLGGHSLGGHLSSITAGQRTDIAGVVHLACGFPYHGFYGAATARKIKTLCRLLPLLTWVLGYFPGDRLGFGAREYRRLMMDWREWALGGSYNIAATPDAEEGIAGFKGRVLSLSFDHDHYASDDAIRYSYSRFKQGDVTVRRLTATEQGEFLGHFDWAKNPRGVVAAISDWMGI